jgi:hypothetical protein
MWVGCIQLACREAACGGYSTPAEGTLLFSPNSLTCNVISEKQPRLPRAWFKRNCLEEKSHKIQRQENENEMLLANIS